VDSLLKEKESLIFELQSAKKDTNQAKYEHFHFVVVSVASEFGKSITDLF